MRAEGTVRSMEEEELREWGGSDNVEYEWL